MKKIVPDVESAINRLIDDFQKNPYLHRVEHSLHCELFAHLIASEELGKTEDYGSVQPRRVQKEWPETLTRPDRERSYSRRGNFDLVVLGPSESNLTTIIDAESFQLGLITPGVVIEIGLDYGLQHLKGDLAKVLNSQVRYGYLVHMSRRTHRSKTVEELERWIGNHRYNGIQIAYAQVVDNGKALRCLKLGESSIKRVRI